MGDSAGSKSRREALRALSTTEREAALELIVRNAVASALGREPEAVARDARWSELEGDPAKLIGGAIRPALIAEAGFGLYPNEYLDTPTIGDLARYLAAEMVRDGAPLAETPPIHWRWEVKPVSPPAERIPGPVFLLSGPRTGSTLTRVMLAGHPGLFSPPELMLLPWATMRERQQTLDRSGIPFMGLGLQQALTELLQSDAEGAAEHIRRWVAEDTPVQQVYAELQERAAPRLLVDKSPMYSLRPGWLEPAEALFTGARYVFLYRHPYAVIESFVRMRFERLFGPGFDLWDNDPHVFAERMWARCNENVLRFLERIEPERQHRVCYEEMVRDPVGTMQSVCRFLGLPYDEGVVKPYDGGRMTYDDSRQSHTIGDPNLLTHDRIDPSLADAWRRQRPAHSLSQETARIASVLGYELG